MLIVLYLSTNNSAHLVQCRKYLAFFQTVKLHELSLPGKDETREAVKGLTERLSS